MDNRKLVSVIFLLICGVHITAQEEPNFLPFGNATYLPSQNTLCLTVEDTSQLSGMIYRDEDQPLTLSMTGGFYAPIIANLGSKNIDGGHGFLIILSKYNNIDSLADGLGDTLGYKNIPNSIAIEFDTYSSTNSIFNDYLPEDHLSIVANSIFNAPLSQLVSILHPKENADLNVENGNNHAIELNYDPFTNLLEVFINQRQRLAYQIDLQAYFDQDFLYISTVGTTDELATNKMSFSPGGKWTYESNIRNLKNCNSNNNVKNLGIWIVANNPDYGSWQLKKGTNDKLARQLAYGEPSFLTSPINLLNIEARCSFRIDSTGEGFAGIWWGYSLPFAQWQDTYRGFCLDWKGASGELEDCTGTQLQEGFTLAWIDGDIPIDDSAGGNPYLCTHDSSDIYRVLATDYGNGKGWETGIDYDVHLYYTKDSFAVWITQETNNTIDTLCFFTHMATDIVPHSKGRIAMYSYEQAGVRFSDFDYQWLHSFTPSDSYIYPEDEIVLQHNSINTCLPTLVKSMFWGIEIGDDIFTSPAITDDTLYNLPYIFTTPGAYPVALILEDSAGCSQTYFDTVFVSAKVPPNFGGIAHLCPEEILFLTIPSLGIPALWQDSTQSSSYIVDQPGIYWAEYLVGDSLRRDSIEVIYRDTIQYDVDVHASCYGQDDGQVKIEVVNWTSQYNVKLNGMPGLVHHELVPGFYDLYIEDIYGCIVEETIELTEACKPEYELLIDTVTCFGFRDGSISISPQNCPLNIGNADAASLNNYVLGNLSAGDYEITITDTIGCIWDTIITIHTPPPFLVQITPQDTTIYYGECVSINISPSYGDSAIVNITPSTGLDFTNHLQVQASPLSTQTYHIFLQNDVGCEADTEIRVHIDESIKLYWPTAFTPNGDGINEWFYPQAGGKGKGIDKINYIRIFSRTGNMVFETKDTHPDDPLAGWDGNLNGKPLNSGTYTVIAEWVYISDDGKEREPVRYKGDVEIIR